MKKEVKVFVFCVLCKKEIEKQHVESFTTKGTKIVYYCKQCCITQ